MLHEQFNLLVETLDVKGSDIAQYADISTARISRLRSGAEEPQRENPVMTQLVRGFFKLAAETGKTQKLYNLMGIQAADSAAAQTEQALDWLYTTTSGDRTRSDKIAHFCKCFDILLELSGMTLKTLSEACGTDYSYIYRVHKGERFPRPGSRVVSLLCDAMLKEIRNVGKLPVLSAMTSIPEELCSAETLRDWLFQTTDYADTAAVRKLVGEIERFGIRELPPLPQMRQNIFQNPPYIGNLGLQAAVTRFLSGIEPGQELLLYSDHPMDWMTGAYKLKWAAMMARCLKIGVRIRIIHNIDREIPEMLEAIRSWMPLYFSGQITPYYSTCESGSRFRHTIFLCPGHAAVTGFSPAEAECEFRYVTDTGELARLEAGFSSLLGSCLPLLTVSDAPQKPEGKALSRRFGDAEVLVDRKCAIVNKMTAPQMSFRFLHPDMIGAFRMLLER